MIVIFRPPNARNIIRDWERLASGGVFALVRASCHYVKYGCNFATERRSILWCTLYWLHHYLQISTGKIAADDSGTVPALKNT